MISPGGILQFTGDFDELDKDVSALRSDAIGIRNGGADVHSRFQMLGAFYTAPEADTLFATTRPVMDKADTFAAKLETVADALDTFAIEARPLAERLKQLKADAVAFTDSVEGDDDWTEDEKKVDRNKQLIDDVTATQSAFQDAERRAASKITAVVGGPAFVTDDGSGLVKRNTVPYGYDPALFEGAKELPWGSVDDKTYESWSLGWFGHGAKSLVWDGIYKDGIEAAAKGLWALGTGDGEAWSGLKDVATGIGLYTITPYDAFMDWAVGPDKESADEVRAKKAAKEFAKGIVAWDQWEENPARATGTVLFNVLTLGAGPLAAASKAGKGGLASNAAGAAAKAGLYLDPLYVGLKATGAAAGKLPKLSDLTSRITTGAGTAADTQRVHSVIELEDGSRVVIENGEFIPYDRHGNVMSDVPNLGRATGADNVPERAPAQNHELAGVGAVSRAPEASAQPGESMPRSGNPESNGNLSSIGPTHSGRATGEESGGHRTEAGNSSRGGRGDVPGPSGHTGSAEGVGPEGVTDAGSDIRSGGTDSGEGSGSSDGASERGPIELGGPAERGLRDGIQGIPRNTIKPKVVERIVTRLGKEPSGQEIAGIISSGHLSRMPGYKDVVAMLGSGIQSHFPSAVDQIRLAEQFYRSGLRNIEFEIKNSAIKADIDVRVTDDAGKTYGYQLKRLQNPKNPFESIAKADHLGQLSKSAADNKIMLVDGQGTIADWEARGTFDELLQVHRGDHPVKSEKGRGILFVLRLDDGTVVIPPGSKVDPRGVL
ncbi:hypothetical protein ABZ759_19230 [Streptomyces sp. NPDC047860]|uniref:hypothetical protein n=1 Tax=Streptomyces sp. NPDC047860 TaxID=3155743 RepID=UPI0033FF28CE